MEARDVIVIKTAGDTVRKWKQEGGQCPQRELKGSDGQANAQTRKESKIKRKQVFNKESMRTNPRVGIT